MSEGVEVDEGHDAEQAELVPQPRPLLRARLAVYLAEDQKLVIALRVDGEEEDRHMVIPKALVRLASRHYGVDLQRAIAAAAEEQH